MSGCLEWMVSVSYTHLEMHFDGNEFTIHIDVFDSCCDAKLFQLVQLACADFRCV